MSQVDITRLLVAIRDGDRGAEDDLYRALYDELRVIAHRQLGRYHPDTTLSTTALVHEAYLKLAGAKHFDFVDRRHLLATLARAMRQVLVDYARSKRTEKRGSGAPHTLFEEGEEMGPALITAEVETLLALEQALEKLAVLDERLVRVMELRFYGGLSVEEVAEVLNVSPPTVKRDTRAAKAFIYSHMGGSN